MNRIIARNSDARPHLLLRITRTGCVRGFVRAPNLCKNRPAHEKGSSMEGSAVL
jgi:hypothetical protein